MPIDETGYPKTSGLEQAADNVARALGLPKQPADRKHAFVRGNPVCLICGAPKSEDAPPFCEVSDC